jgi:membrane fusion protein, multidrug efflux system
MTCKINDMQNILGVVLAALVISLLAACNGNAAKDPKEEIGNLKAKLEKLKKEKNGLDVQIRQVEEQLVKADPSSQVQKLVTIDTVEARDFAHYVELQGKIDAENVAYVSPSGMGGVVKAVYFKTGDQVRKGQAILKLDDVLPRQGLVAAQQQAGVLKSRLEQAQTIYERHQNLWKQNIGAEINVINAKAEVDALSSQLRAAEAQVRAAQEQLSQTNVTAQISGTIDQLSVKVGEFFSPQTAADPRVGQIKIVNNSTLKMISDVPENYASRIKKGNKVEVIVPESGRPPFESTIDVVGAAVNPATRSFTVEAKLPPDPVLKSNQLATVKILDYEAKGVITVSVNVLQIDEQGKYVFVAEKTGNKMIVRKKPVVVGESYEGLIEIKSGLKNGDLIISEGYQTVYDGQAVSISIPTAGPL